MHLFNFYLMKYDYVLTIAIALIFERLALKLELIYAQEACDHVHTLAYIPFCEL